MLFSDDEVAKELNEKFECSWESVRKVPKVEIDFGDGRKLTRTLAGNVATYLCTSDGRVLDVVPGVCPRDEYLGRVRLGERFHETIAALGEGSRKEAVRRYHAAMERGEKASRPELERLAASERARPDMSKALVEDRIKHAMKGAADLIAARAATAPDPRADASKRAVESPVKHSLHDDADFNDRERAPRIHALLAKRPLELPSAYTKALYKDVLNVDLDDPYLGLAPYVLGGEPGRSSP